MELTVLETRIVKLYSVVSFALSMAMVKVSIRVSSHSSSVDLLSVHPVISVLADSVLSHMCCGRYFPTFSGAEPRDYGKEMGLPL